MKITKELAQKMREAVVAHLSEVSSATRGELLDGATARLGLSDRQMQDRNAWGTYYTLRSYIGGVVDALVQEGSIGLREHRYILTQDDVVIVKEGQCEAQIKALLSKRAYQKHELFGEIDRHFGADKTPSRKDNAMLHSMVGTILSRLVKRGDVTVGNDGYTIDKQEKRLKNVPMAREPFKKAFLARLHRMGGPFFEHFLCNLLEKYYTVTGRDVLVCEVTGGSSDGGVDVIVDTRDGLGFFEHIMVQAKCRERLHVTEKEVREFYGALTALSGSRGIYATTSTFHVGAKRLLDSLDNCVGIDGDKLFELAEKTAYGMIKGKNGYRFDEAIFTK